MERALFYSMFRELHGYLKALIIYFDICFLVCLFFQPLKKGILIGFCYQQTLKVKDIKIFII